MQQNNFIPVNNLTIKSNNERNGFMFTFKKSQFVGVRQEDITHVVYILDVLHANQEYRLLQKSGVHCPCRFDQVETLPPATQKAADKLEAILSNLTSFVTNNMLQESLMFLNEIAMQEDYERTLLAREKMLTFVHEYLTSKQQEVSELFFVEHKDFKDGKNCRDLYYILENKCYLHYKNSSRKGKIEINLTKKNSLAVLKVSIADFNEYDEHWNESKEEVVLSNYDQEYNKKILDEKFQTVFGFAYNTHAILA